MKLNFNFIQNKIVQIKKKCIAFLGFKKTSVLGILKLEYKKAENRPILFWSTGGMPPLLEIENSIAVSLNIRDFKTCTIVCDGLFEACVQCEFDNNSCKSNCVGCKNRCIFTMKKFGNKYDFLGNFISSKTKKKINLISKQFSYENLDQLYYRNVFLGKYVKSSIARFLKGKPLDLQEDTELVKKYILSAMYCAEAAFNVIEKYKPFRIFMSHAVYVDYGPMLQVAFLHNIPVVTYVGGYLSAYFYFKCIDNKDFINVHGVCDEYWDNFHKKELSLIQTRSLNSFFNTRYEKQACFDLEKFDNFTDDNIEYLLKKYDLSREKPIWCIMAHLNWDNVFDLYKMLYDDFNDWIICTVKEILLNKNVQWLIKIHPAEMWEKQKYGIYKLIIENFELQKHVKMILPDEKINPLAFYHMINGAVTVCGTAGLELATLGKPVILSGQAHYGNKGFTIDAKFKEEYLSHLKNAHNIKPLTNSQVELAQKYAYLYFIQRQIPLNVIDKTKGHWGGLDLKKLDLLLPGRDPVMDKICDCIVTGSDVILDEDILSKLDKSSL